jgi:hypothetical protein
MSIEDDQMANIRSADMQRYIDECESCHDICLQVVVYCLRQGGRHAEVGHSTTVLDCADMCATSANFMLRESTMHRRTCEVCAEVCDACAKSCDQFPNDDVMRRCAEECRRCAESCREMVRGTA